MDRRAFISMLAYGAAASPFVTRAQIAITVRRGRVQG